MSSDGSLLSSPKRSLLFFFLISRQVYFLRTNRKSSPAAEHRSSRLYFSVHYSLPIGALLRRYRPCKSMLKMLPACAYMLSWVIEIRSMHIQDTEICFFLSLLLFSTLNIIDTREKMNIDKHTFTFCMNTLVGWHSSRLVCRGCISAC